MARRPGTSWRAILESVPDALVIVDGSGTVIGCNAFAGSLFGRDPDTMIGQPVDVLRASGEGPGLDWLLGGNGADRRPTSTVLLCNGENGAVIELEARAAPVDLDGVGAWVVLLRESAVCKVVEDALMAVEERLASISANVPGIVFQRVLRADGSIQYPFFSEGVRDVLGYQPSEMRVNADGCLDVIHWADRERHLVDLRVSALSLMTCPEEFRAITKSGEVRWLSGSSRPEVIDDGTIRWDGVLIDVSERKRAEQRLEMILDHAADSIITMDEAGDVETFNAAAERLWGYAGDDIVGRPVALLLPEPYRREHVAALAQHLETGDGPLVSEDPRELSGLRKDGSTFPLEFSTSEVRMEGRRLFIFIGRDITQRKQTEAALRETEQRLRSIAANLPGIVFQRVLRPDGTLAYPYLSEGTRDVLGREPGDIMADPNLFLQALEPDDRESFIIALQRSAENLEPFDDEMRVQRLDGQVRWLRGRSRPRILENGDVAWDGVTLDVTDRKEAEERLLFLAYYDPVTGIANRTLFLDFFNNAKRLSKRSGLWVAVLCIGIDRFGMINSTLGHAVGDEVLAAAANRLRSCLGPGDTIARAGGDRFLILATKLKNERDVSEVVERVVASTRRPVEVGGEEFDLTASIGVSVFPRDGDDASTLVKHADAALLRAKAQGPGSIQVFSEEMNAHALKTLSLRNRMRRALDQGEFVAYYQPQVDLRTGRIVGTEALARWISPDGVSVSPAEFIPVAEEHGLIDEVCQQVLLDACRQNREWQDAGYAPIPVAVNVSGRQFQHPRRLMQMLESVLAQSGLDPRYLELELTESSAMSDPNNAIAIVAALKEMGIACAIDDFGTGYSSLSVLKRFPIHKLKIDRSFVMDITTDFNDAAIVNAIIAMAHALRLKVVAEGVELMAHLEFLRDLGCDQMQGYLFSRPVAAAELTRMLGENRQLPVAEARALQS
ncbi:MAG: EAL domain-containing protein [Rhodospirillales bacterium]|nr:EAL domain-containing protein [Rhodospirillales bacterium]